MRYAMIIFVLLCAFATPARADSDGWQSLSDGVDVLVNQVGETNTYTWKFHNDRAGTITYLEFQYADKTGTHTRVINKGIRSGAVYTHEGFKSEGLTSMTLINVVRKPDK